MQHTDNELWNWFGIGRSTWLTIPRVLLHEMPEDWQNKMAELLNQYEQTFPNQPDLKTRVQVTDLNNKLVKTPDWLLNYRHPVRHEIEKLKRGADA